MPYTFDQQLFLVLLGCWITVSFAVRKLHSLVARCFNVSLDKLAKVTDICGREIREAVVDAAIRVALNAKKSGLDPASGEVKLKDLLEAIERKKAERITPQSRELEPEEKEEVSRKVKSALEAKQKEHEQTIS